MTTFEFPRSEDKLIILKRIPVFASCTDEQLRLIAERTRLVEYKKGECIYQQGNPATAFYIVSSGRLRVFSQSNDQEKTFTVLHNGDSFGEISLLTGETHSATVQALNDTLVLQLEKQDFDEVINRIPSLVLFLSRLLSKRLRTKEHTGEFSDATIVAIYSAAENVGRTSFAIALATLLKRETGQPTLIVDLATEEAPVLYLYGPSTSERTTRYTLSRETAEEPFQAACIEHSLGFSVLFAGELLSQPDGEQTIAPLLNALTKHFHYLLIDLPAKISPHVLKGLTQADLIYLMTDPSQANVTRTNALLHQVQSFLGPTEQRMKLVVNLCEPTQEQLTPAQVAEQLGQPVAHTLPYVPVLSSQLTIEELSRLLDDPTSSYVLTIKRMARELGGLLVGLALGSGAALGLAHIGVLKVIERERIPIDLIAGSSIGALVGGLWAAGRSADELEQMAMSYKNPWDVRRLFILDLGIPLFSVVIGLVAGIAVGWLAEFWTGFLFGFMVTVALGLILGPLAGGPIQGARLMAKLEKDFAGKTFEDTRVPLQIVAANPMSREEMVFNTGSLAEAVRASVSIPGIFKPVVYRGKVCLDGGVINPIPVSVLKRAGAKHIIAVNVFPTNEELAQYLQQRQALRVERDAHLASRPLYIRLLFRVRQELMRSISPLIFDVIMRSMQSMEYQIAEVACREADLTLRPTVPGSHWLEFFHPEKFIRRGEEVALEHLPMLRRLTRLPERSVDNPMEAQ